MWTPLMGRVGVDPGSTGWGPVRTEAEATRLRHQVSVEGSSFAALARRALFRCVNARRLPNLEAFTSGMGRKRGCSELSADAFTQQGDWGMLSSSLHRRRAIVARNAQSQSWHEQRRDTAQPAQRVLCTAAQVAQRFRSSARSSPLPRHGHVHVAARLSRIRIDRGHA